MADRIYFTTVAAPIGELRLTSDGEALTAIFLPRPGGGSTPPRDWLRDETPFRAAREQLDAYFAGDLQNFDLPLRPEGTAFQQLVWRELCRIPYGETAAYVEIARRIGRPTASRAVGAANGQNPLPIVVPCHRVIAADGTLGGFGGGLDCKRWLLRHEGEHGAVGATGRLAFANLK
jgi:methylated-DNA-[protein]-cysteine S-methyltransferase